MELLALPEKGVDLLRPFAHAAGSSARWRERAILGFRSWGSWDERRAGGGMCGIAAAGAGDC
jgi:hypothetical protein